MEAVASIKVNLFGVFCELAHDGNGDLYRGKPHADVSDALAEATGQLKANGYRQRTEWEWTGGAFRADIEETDHLLTYPIQGTQLQDITTSAILADLLNRAESRDLVVRNYAEGANWRVQFGYDKDNDQTLLVHNGQRWIAAWRSDERSRWVEYAGLPVSLSQTPLVDASQWLHDIEMEGTA